MYLLIQTSVDTDEYNIMWNFKSIAKDTHDFVDFFVVTQGNKKIDKK